MLTLIPVILIDGTGLGEATLIDQTATHTPLEEGLAALARELTVVLAARLVRAHHALDENAPRTALVACADAGRRRNKTPAAAQH